MRLAVGDVERPVGGGKQAVRPRQLALQRIGSGPSPRTPVPRTVAIDAAVEIDASNRVVLGIGQIEGSPGQREPLWSGEPRQPCRSAVPGISLLAGAGEVMQRARRGAMR